MFERDADRTAPDQREAEGAPLGFLALTPLHRTIPTLARNYQSYMDSAVSCYGLNSSHVPLLAYLWEGHSGDRQNDIARNLGVDKGTVSRNVQALVRLGLVTQTCNSRDSRACTVTLTEKGRALAEPVLRASSSWAESVCTGMGDDACTELMCQLAQMCKKSNDLVACTKVEPSSPAVVDPGVDVVTETRASVSPFS